MNDERLAKEGGYDEIYTNSRASENQVGMIKEDQRTSFKLKLEVKQRAEHKKGAQKLTLSKQGGFVPD